MIRRDMDKCCRSVLRLFAWIYFLREYNSNSHKQHNWDGWTGSCTVS